MEVREGMSSVGLGRGPGHTLRETATKMTEKGTGGRRSYSTMSRPARGSSPSETSSKRSGSGKDPDVEKVADHMSESVISAAPDWSLEQAAEEMGAAEHPPPGHRRPRRAGRRPLDEGHRALLTQVGGDLVDVTALVGRITSGCEHCATAPAEAGVNARRWANGRDRGDLM